MANVDTIVTSTTDAIATLTASCVTAVSKLNDIGAAWTQTFIDPVTGVTLSTGYTPLINALTDALADIEAFTFDFTGIILQPLPDAPVIDPRFLSPEWSDTKWESVKSAIDNFIVNIVNTDDVDTVIQKLTNTSSTATKLEIAMFAKDYEFKSQLLRDAYSAANSATGAKGFTFPNILTVALKLKAQQDFQFSLGENAKDLIKYIFDWSKTNYQFAIEKGISAQQADMDFNIKFANALIQSYTATITGIVETYKAKIYEVIAKAKAEIEVIDAKVQIMKTHAGTLTTIDDLRVKEYAARISDDVKRIELILTEQANATDNKIKAYSAAAQASASMATSSSQIVLGTAS